MDSMRKTVLASCACVLGMFAFGFALVPLYDVFCDITGLNGKTEAGPAKLSAAQLEVQPRQVTVQFTASNNAGSNWEFRPLQAQLKVQPGQMNALAFYARNPNGVDQIAQAVPSVTPSEAARYLHKTECFCFNHQPLAAGASTEMPLRFVIDPALPAHIRTLTLAYTLFDITDAVQADQNPGALAAKEAK